MVLYSVLAGGVSESSLCHLRTFPPNNPKRDDSLRKDIHIYRLRKTTAYNWSVDCVASRHQTDQESPVTNSRCAKSHSTTTVSKNFVSSETQTLP